MKAKNLKDFKAKHNSKLFFDTNVWLYLYYPQHSQVSKTIIDRYSSLFSEVLSKNCLIVTDMIQMSELINLTLQLEYKAYCKKNPYLSFKEFRDKNEYKEGLQNAKDFSTNILKTVTLRGGIFTPEELKTIVNKCDRADFNDIYFAQFCYKENAILITHDFDFNALDVEVELYTCNGRYLE